METLVTFCTLLPAPFLTILVLLSTFQVNVPSTFHRTVHSKDHTAHCTLHSVHSTQHTSPRLLSAIYQTFCQSSDIYPILHCTVLQIYLYCIALHFRDISTALHFRDISTALHCKFTDMKNFTNLFFLFFQVCLTVMPILF